VREKLEHNRFLFASANVVNHPLLSHVHARLGAIHDPGAVSISGPLTRAERQEAVQRMERRWVGRLRCPFGGGFYGGPQPPRWTVAATCCTDHARS
jgi:hypothetical protein